MTQIQFDQLSKQFLEEVLAPLGQVQRSFGAVARPDWETGIYWLPIALRAAIVSINKLPATPDTLRLRILGRGKTQQQAIAEVRSLERTDPQRSQILRILANWKVSLERNSELAAADREVIMALSQAYLEWEQATEQRGLERGIEQGARSGKASLILTLLTAQLGAIAPTWSNVIQALSSPQLDALAIALLSFTSSRDLEQWLADLEIGRHPPSDEPI